MELEYLTWALAIATFAFIMTFTPGPNNIMLATSGANYGIRRSMPHVLGVAFGFPAMLLIVASGVSIVLEHEIARNLLRITGVCYVLYIAYRIAAFNNLSDQSVATPLSFWQAALFQWINPKAWAQAIGVSSAYLTIEHDQTLQILAMAVIFLPIGVASSFAWTVFGTQFAKLLNSRKKLRLFNIVMATALVLTVLPVILSY